MRPAWAFIALAGAWAAADARGQSETARSARGGLLARTDHYRVEVFFYRTGVRVFPADRAGVPLDVSRLAGTATFYHPNAPEPWFSRPLRAIASGASLDLAIGLADVRVAGVTVTIALAGLPEPAEPAVSLTVPMEFVTEPAAGGIGTTTRPSRPRDGPPPRSLSPPGLGYGGLGYRPSTGLGPGLPRVGGPPVSLYGYGRVPALGAGTPIPYVSGHGVFILPSGR